MAKRNTRKKEGSISSLISNHILNSQTFPLILVLSTIGIMFVLIRMKGVEQDYQYNEVSKKLHLNKIENKELKAKKASMLSSKKLKIFAEKYNLKQPSDAHVIVIP